MPEYAAAEVVSEEYAGVRVMNWECYTRDFAKRCGKLSANIIQIVYCHRLSIVVS